MKTLNELIQLLDNEPHIQRFKQLESIIDKDKDLQQQYKSLLDAQKIMVNREVKKDPRYKEAKADYEQRKEQLMQHLLMNEYLDLLEEINNDLNMIQEIIEFEIVKDFD